MMVCTELFKHL